MQTDEAARECGLPRAGLSNDCQALSLEYLQIDAVQHFCLPIAGPQAFSREHSLLAGHTLRCSITSAAAARLLDEVAGADAPDPVVICPRCQGRLVCRAESGFAVGTPRREATSLRALSRARRLTR